MRLPRVCSCCRGALWCRSTGIWACAHCDLARDWVWYRTGICRHNDEHGSCKPTTEKGNEQ